MAIKFPKIKRDDFEDRRDDDFEGFYPNYNDAEMDDEGVKVRSFEQEEEEDNGSFGGINEAAVSLKLLTPKESGDARKVADCLIAGSSVVLNIENLKPEEVIRFLDFLFGVVYVLHGNIKNVSKSTIIVTPKNVGVEGEGDVEI